jgi:hypothetical protein
VEDLDGQLDPFDQPTINTKNPTKKKKRLRKLEVIKKRGREK